MFIYLSGAQNSKAIHSTNKEGEKREKNNNKWVACLSIIPHITQLSTLWGHVTAGTADRGQSGWPELLQSVISVFDQPDYRDLTDHMVGVGGGQGGRERHKHW